MDSTAFSIYSRKFVWHVDKSLYTDWAFLVLGSRVFSYRAFDKSKKL